MPRQPRRKDAQPPGNGNAGGGDKAAFVGSYDPKKLLKDILRRLVERGEITPEEARHRLEMADSSEQDAS